MLKRFHVKIFFITNSYRIRQSCKVTNLLFKKNQWGIVSSYEESQPAHKPDPTEIAGLFEGDIVIRNDELFEGRNALIDKNIKWRNATVPYLISSKFDEKHRSVIARAVLEFQRQTCITFIPRSKEQDYIMITSVGNGCSSDVGRIGGQQNLTLGKGCIYTGIIMHEFMHAIGFKHEQSRWDRDAHVVVYFNNILSGKEENFQKLSWKETQNFSAPYDTSSIMHYKAYAFSKNRRKLKTIAPKVPNDKMGQRTNFSESDVYKINRLYNCSQKLDGNSFNSGSDSEATVTSQSPNGGDPSYSQKCMDNHHNCEKWAGNGECHKNPKRMMVNCKQSYSQCRMYYSLCASCSNNNNHCEAWTANVECTKIECK